LQPAGNIFSNLDHDMSADLFAAFSSPVEDSSKRQTNQTSVTSTHQNQPPSDPFSSLPQSQTQTSWQTAQPVGTNHVGQSQWPPPQPQVGVRNDNVWGDFAGFGATPAAKPPAVAQETEQDDDGWGDFEVAPQPKPPVPPVNMQRANAAHVPEPEFSPRTRILRASTLDLIANKLVDDGSASKVEPWQERPSWDRRARQETESPRPKPKPKNQDPNVLFDADDFNGEPPEEEDEFGDFETVPSQARITVPVAAPVPVPSAAAAVDLLGLDSEPSPTSTRKQPPEQLLSTLSLHDSPYPSAPKSPSFQERNPFPGLGLTTPRATEFPMEVKEKEPSPVTAWPTAEGAEPGVEAKRSSFDNDWGEFELESPAEQKKPKPTTSKTVKNAPVPTPPGQDEAGWDWEEWEKSDMPAAPKSAKQESGPPPTNIPPPSILMSLFPELLNLANDTLFKPLNNQPLSIKDRVLSDSGTLEFMRGYLALATVAARIIAGRKLRWHRDKFLSQNMTISAAGGKGGMKLAGIDKSQAAREDREAADVISVWRDIVGRLRGAVAAVNAAIAKQGAAPLRLPELNENVAVQTAKNVPTAPKACVICGLKRDERVPRVDANVEDSFGEWWVEFWGHRACRNFWLEHEAKLRQR
jgi:hypothetical protein